LIEGDQVLNYVEMTWLGQAGFLLRSASSALAIDPFLSEHELRLYPPPPVEVLGGRLDYLLVTHEHLDHLDVQLLPVLVEAFPTLTIVVPSPVVPRITGLVPEARVIGLQPGEAVTGEQVTIRAVSAIHARAGGEAYSDGRQERDDPTPFLGYVLLYRGLTVYHAGASQQLIRELSAHAIDVAILPVNGRGYFRELAGIAGNLNPRGVLVAVIAALATQHLPSILQGIVASWLVVALVQGTRAFLFDRYADAPMARTLVESYANRSPQLMRWVAIPSILQAIDQNEPKLFEKGLFLNQLVLTVAAVAWLILATKAFDLI